MYHRDLALKDRVYHCSFCGSDLDRDHNAAINLEQYFYFFVLVQVRSYKLDMSVAESSAETLNACGETVRPAYVQARLNESGKTAPVKINIGPK